MKNFLSAKFSSLFFLLTRGQAYLAYENYVAHSKRHHKNREILSYAEFFRSEQQRKWQSIKRCC